MGSKSSSQTIGYHYRLGIHMILCHGPIDGIRQIWVGEKLAWPLSHGTIPTSTGRYLLLAFSQIARMHSTSTPLVEEPGTVAAIINEPNLFGGERAEGGIVGKVDLCYGTSAQGQNGYLVSKLGNDLPAYRGLAAAVLNQVRLGTSPYIKPWAFLATRINSTSDESPQWYVAKAQIGDYDMNPAHIVRECLTNTIWGLGYSASDVDDTSFTKVANTLYDEGFGLSFLWESSTTIDDFIMEVLRHVDGMLYQDLSTGKFKLALARDDYELANLGTFDDSSIIEVTEFTRGAFGEIPNQVCVRYHDRANNKDASVTVQDIAMIERQNGAVIGITADYKGICDPALANWVAARELRQSTAMLASMTITCNRTMGHLSPNDVFLLNWPPLGISNLPVRIFQANYGELADGKITFKVVEDIFKAASALYAQPTGTKWTDPVPPPIAATNRLLIEAPYWTLARGGIVADSDSAYLVVAAVRPSSGSKGYTLLVSDTHGGDFTDRGDFGWTPSATVPAMTQSCNDVTLNMSAMLDLDQVAVGSVVQIDNELLAITAIDIANGTITLARGVLDTVPASHSIGARVWFLEAVSAFVNREYVTGETPDAQVLTITGQGVLNPASASIDCATAFNQRQARPYAPGNVRINNVLYGASFTGQPTISWAHRDRTEQTASVIHQDMASIGPEAGVTYTLKVRDQNGVLRRTETGLTGTSYLYTEANERADCLLGPSDPLNTSLSFELYAVRDSLDSWQKHTLTVSRV
jgi:hypothetical protein